MRAADSLSFPELRENSGKEGDFRHFPHEARVLSVDFLSIFLDMWHLGCIIGGA